MYNKYLTIRRLAGRLIPLLAGKVWTVNRLQGQVLYITFPHCGHLSCMPVVCYKLQRDASYLVWTVRPDQMDFSLVDFFSYE